MQELFLKFTKKNSKITDYVKKTFWPNIKLPTKEKW